MKHRFLGILLVFTLFTIGAAAYGSTPAVTLTLPSINVDPSQIGQTITVPIVVSDLTGLGVTGYNFNLTYDKSIVQYVSYSKVGTISNSMSMIVPVDDAAHSRLGFAAAGSNILTGQGTLINFQFMIKATGNSPLVILDEYNGVKTAVNDTISPAHNTGQIKIGNEKPTMTAIAPISASEKDTVRFTAVGNDPDNDSLTYTMTGAPAGASIDSKTGKFLWIPPYGSKGTYPIVVKCTDTGRLKDSTSVTMTIAKKNVKPALAAITAKSVTERDTLKFTIAAVDSNGDAITYDVKSLPSALFTVNPTTGAFFWVPDTGASGVYAMITVAKDVDNATDTVKFSITVAKKNFIPVIQKIAAKSVTEADTVKFIVSGSDGYQEKITYSAAPLPIGAKLDSVSGDFSWVPAIGKAGKYTIVFKASDPSGLFDTTSAFITVVSKNQKPVLVSMIKDTTVDEGKPLAFTFLAIDPNNDAVTYSLEGAVPAGASINSSTGVFAWTPTYTQSGSYTFAVKATDPSGAFDSVAAKVTVADVNRKPVIAVKAPVQKIDSVTVATNIYFKTTATDPDADGITYTWKLNGVIIKSGSDSLYTANFATVSTTTQNVVCVFTDAKGASDSSVWSFKVVKLNLTSVEDHWPGAPTEFMVGQNYPNPFNPSTTIKFGLPKAAPVTLVIYNILGEKVRTLINGSMMDAAYHNVVWDGRSDAGSQVSSGMYLYRIEADKLVSTMKMLLMK